MEPQPAHLADSIPLSNDHHSLFGAEYASEGNNSGFELAWFPCPNLILPLGKSLKTIVNLVSYEWSSTSLIPQQRTKSQNKYNTEFERQTQIFKQQLVEGVLVSNFTEIILSKWESNRH